MKKFMIFIILFLWLALFGIAHHFITPLEELKINDVKSEILEDGKKVYITENGEKYHQAGCRSLRQGYKEVPMDEVLRAKMPPCTLCN